jgi:hypothetical protein
VIFCKVITSLRPINKNFILVSLTIVVRKKVIIFYVYWLTRNGQVGRAILVTKLSL